MAAARHRVSALHRIEGMVERTGISWADRSYQSRRKISRYSLAAGIGLLMVLSMLGVLRVAAGSPPLQAQAQAQETSTELLAEAISHTATIQFSHGILDDPPMVVFYKSGKEPVVQPDEDVGTLVYGNQAVSLVTVACPEALTMPSSVSAVCLNMAAPGTGNVLGVYKGTATLLLPAEPTGVATEDSEEEKPASTVDVTVTVRRHWVLFAIIATLGTLFSLWAGWYVTEGRRLRKLQSDYKALPGSLGCNECSPPETASLKLVKIDDLFSADQKKILEARDRGLWPRSLIGDRPDYEALEKSIAQAKDAPKQFCELCRVHAALSEDREQITKIFSGIGGEGGVLLAAKIDREIAALKEIEASKVEEQLKSWPALHALAVQWLQLAQLVKYLRDWGGNCKEDDKEKMAACAHIDAARSKLAMIQTTADMTTLQPDVDIRAAWELLALWEQSLPDGKRKTWATLAEQQSVPDAALNGIGVSSIPGDIGDWLSASWEKWTPALSKTMIQLLFVASLATTIFVGGRLLYAGKPWGTWQDMLFLLAVGTGVHAGLSGLAAKISAPQSSEK